MITGPLIAEIAGLIGEPARATMLSALLDGRALTATERLVALLEPLGHIAWDTQGAGEYPYAKAVVEWNAAGFVAAIEAEDEPAAIARSKMN